MLSNGFEYDIGLEERGESMRESPLVARPGRLVHVDEIRRGFTTPVFTGISEAFVSMKNICAALLNPFDLKRPLVGVLLSLLAIPSQAGDDAQHGLQ